MNKSTLNDVTWPLVLTVKQNVYCTRELVYEDLMICFIVLHHFVLLSKLGRGGAEEEGAQ